MTTAMKTEHTQTPFGYILPVSFKPNASFQDESGKFCFRISYADGKTCCIARTNSAALIVRAVNSYESMKEALEFTEKSEIDHANCDYCDGEIEAEQCGTCFPLADKARIARRAALKLAKGE